MSATAASLRVDGERLRLSGTLDRAAAAALWPQAVAAVARVRVLDLDLVDAVDSAGLALLVALSARIDAPTLHGTPRGLDELLAAYRLSPTLRFDHAR